MTETETWTIGRLLEWTTAYLRRQGVESARLDAEVLLAEARQCQRIDLYTQFAEVASEPLRTAFRDLVRRRAEGIPVAYLVGRREFYSLAFRVTPDVLVPRPETEFVILSMLDRLRPRDSTPGQLAIADVGTGSGVLAVCAARELPHSHVIATDISPAALEVARGNAQTHQVAERIDFVTTDLLEAIPPEPRFACVMSNPPYVKESEWLDLPRDVRDHEPRLALVGGPSGWEVIQRLIPQTAERILAGGWLIMEISPMIEETVRQLLREDGRFDPIETVKDLAQRVRVLCARKAH